MSSSVMASPRSTTGENSGAMPHEQHEPPTPRTQLPLAPPRDRFIPSRGSMDMHVSAMEVERAYCGAGHEQEVNASPAKEEYKKCLASNLFGGVPQNNRVLSFGSPRSPSSADGAIAALSTADGCEDTLRMLYCVNRHGAGARREAWGGRHIPQSPERILDAPELLDDYYLNLLDWNAENILAVALGDSVYLWNASSGAITPLMQTAGTGCHVTSIAWAPRGAPQMAIGTSDHKTQIWDTSSCKMVRSMDGHCGRVGVLAWNSSTTLTSGSRDASIVHRDTRSPHRVIATLHGHSQEVCGLKWSPSGTQLASGGNDNLLNIWDDRRMPNGPPVYTLNHHTAAVKALAWCPWQRHVLASGGGTADRMIRFWDLKTGHFVNAVDTHSQVCALQWSMHDKELVSSHGYSHNQLILWKYPSMVKVAELTGHTSRVLHMAQSPDGTTVVSAAADETLRFWKILGSDKAVRQHGRGESVLSAGTMSGASPSAWSVR